MLSQITFPGNDQILSPSKPGPRIRQWPAASVGGVSLVDRVVGTRGQLGGVLSSDASGRQNLSSLSVTIGFDATNLRVMFCGTRGATALPSGITVKAAVWKNGTAYQCLFSGTTSVTLAQDQSVICDTISGLTVSAGDVITVRTYATVSSGSDMWASQYLVGALGDGVERGNALTDKTMSGTITAAGDGGLIRSAYTCSAVIGKAASTGHATVVFGDSLSIGQGDQQQLGYVALALLRNRVPYVRVGAGGSVGTAGLDWLATDPPLRQLIPYTTSAVWEYGINDISSSASSATMLSRVASFASGFAALSPNPKIAVCTVHPYPNSSNTAPKSDAYWSAAKDVVRTTYNSALRSSLPAGVTYLWDVCGDASGASGLWSGGLESSENSGLYRADYAAYSTPTLHPNRPAIYAMSSGLDVTAFLGLPQRWGPEPAFMTIPSSGEYVEMTFVKSRSAVVDVPGSLSGLSMTDGALVVMDPQSTLVKRFYASSRITSALQTLTITANNLVDGLGNQAVLGTTSGSAFITNSSTWGAVPDLGSTLASDNFTRADTAYDAAANNNTAGANWTDNVGSAAKIGSNKLYIKGSASQRVVYSAATYTDIYAEFEFDPADFTASDSDVFAIKFGVRMSLANTNGIFVMVSRGAFKVGTNFLYLNFLSTGTPSQNLGGTSVTWSNGTRYRVGLKAFGSGSTKTIIAYVFNATTGLVIATVTASTSLSSFTNQTGYVGFVAPFAASNSDTVPVTIASEYIVDNLTIKTGADVTAPAISAATLSASGRYITLKITEQSLPLLPTSVVTGFTVKRSGVTQTISSVIINGADNIRIVLASQVSGPLTVSYSGGNVTDQSGNALASFTDYAVS